MTPKITMIQVAAEAHMRRAIAGPLGRFNEMQTGQLEDYRPLAILVSHPDTAEIFGGPWGETMFSTCMSIDCFAIITPSQWHWPSVNE
jgi:hypothetical protein